MTTNEIKKGMRFKLANGWWATMMDNKRGNIRMAEVEGLYKEVGSVYAHDIIACKVDDVLHTIHLTDQQKTHAKTVEQLGL